MAIKLPATQLQPLLSEQDDMSYACDLHSQEHSPEPSQQSVACEH